MMGGMQGATCVPSRAMLLSGRSLFHIDEKLLRDETWVRRDSAVSEETIAQEISALMVERHPDWAGREWIEPGVRCLCSEHPA